MDFETAFNHYKNLVLRNLSYLSNPLFSKTIAQKRKWFEMAYGYLEIMERLYPDEKAKIMGFWVENTDAFIGELERD